MKDDKKLDEKALDLAKIRESLKGQAVRLRTGLKGGEATCGNYNKKLC